MSIENKIAVVGIFNIDLKVSTPKHCYSGNNFRKRFNFRLFQTITEKCESFKRMLVYFPTF